MLILAIITTVELSRLLQRVYLRRYLADPAHTEQQQQQHQSAPLLNHISSSLLERLEFTMETTDRTVSTVASGSKKFVFNADDSQHSFKTTDKNITVVCTEGKHDRGSSKIKLVNVVNFKWEQKNYPGRLIACHKDCYLLAYSIRVTKQSKSEGMVRVAHLDLPERGLIKGLSDEILDLQFSHNSTTECLLGIIERTTLHVHQVLVKGEKVTTALKVKIVDPLEGHVPICDRITWCPYLGDGTDFNDEFAKQLLVWTRGSTFQCYSISVLTKSYIDTTDLKASDIEEGGFKANDGEATITGSVFSDDGTTLALSSSDGLIRFYQVYQHANDRSPRRLHLWKPHDGKPITSFFFLDNYTETVNNKTIWKHAITCAENNAEIKVWCCESWECLQTVRLTSPVEASLHFKAEIDISSTYLVLTERSTRQIYVLQVRKGQSAGSSAESEPNKPTLSKGGTRSIVQPYIVSIAEYPLSASVLGFSILYAAAGNSKYGDYDDDEDDEQASPKCVMIRMFLVQPNNLQDCTLMYEAIPDSESEPLTKELTDDPVRDDAEATESTGNSSSVSSSASNETTDNNVSHGPSEEDDRLLDETAAKGKKVDGKNGAQGTLNNESDNVEEEEEEDDSNNPIALKMAEAAQKLNDVFVSIRTANSSAEGTNVGGTSGPTTPASSSNKVNLMTPDSFSTPGSATRSAGKESVKDVRIINLSELPYPEMETIMNQYDRRTAPTGGRRRGRGAQPVNTTVTTNTTATTTGVRKAASSSVTSTASANGSVSSSDSGGASSDDEQEEEEEEGGGNTSVASVAGSERVITDITDDPDDEDGDEEDTDAEPKPVVKQGKKKGPVKRAQFALANGSTVVEQGKSRKQPQGHGTGAVGQPDGAVISVSGTSLTMEHFTKILTLDEAEPPTVREKIKSDETVNPDVLSTLFMLAKATKQHQQQQPPASVADMVASAGQQVTQPTTMPTTDALEAFVNMVKNRSEAADDSAAAGKAKHRNSTNGPGNNMEEDSVTDAPTVPPMPSAEMLASGGSSPSREVQQIMSTKGPVISMVEDLFLYSCVERKDDYDEEEEEEDDEEEGVVNVADRFDEEDGVVVVVPNGTNDNADEEVVDEKDPEPDVADASVLLSAEKATVAASALKEPTADPTTEREEVSVKRKSSALLRDSPGEESAKVEPNDEPSVSGFWPSSVPTDVPAVGKDVVTTAPPTIVHVPDSSKQIAELSSKLDRMMDLMVAQSRQIEQLNVQLDAMKKTRVEEQRKNSATMNRFNQTLPKTIETQLSGLLVQHSLKMEQTLVSCFNNQQARIAETLTHLPQAMIAQLQGRLLQAIVQEMQQKLLPAINGKLDMVQRAVAADLAEKLRTNEGAIRDSIQRTVRSEPVMKAMSTAIQTGMRTVLYDVYHASLREVILPSYSKQCEELFRQMSKAFSYGILELIQKVDKHLEGIGKMQDRTGELVESVRQLPKELSTTADQTTIATVRALRETIEKDMRGLHASLLRSVREHIRQEIEKGFEAQASSLEDSVLSVVRSQAQTPAPSNMDVQDQIKQYLNGGQINKAFHKALLSNDLSLVEFLLERADHKQVFNPCPLEQTVLLSLIQQISADMANHNELKHKYLSDAIVNLDFQDPITKEHSPKVIMELISNCQKFMTANPQNPLCTSLKMLVIAAQYIGFKNT
uniref:Uncharacterized protein n=1 Tax=Anopheles coluzzii TaxID=1518534 RepID=A0A6E8VWN7_ANOCL|nr:enhancer of mRNA-decapping protein 4 homolog isoform X1 [Anopheles coluzzii]